jgi:hypothetical protein
LHVEQVGPGRMRQCVQRAWRRCDLQCRHERLFMEAARVFQGTATAHMAPAVHKHHIQHAVHGCGWVCRVACQ